MLDFDFEPDLPGWAKNLVAFDLETTGLELETSRIVTASIVQLNASGELENSWEWLINPGIDIPVEASNVHGVTTEMAVANGVQPKLAIAEMVSVLSGFFSDGVAVVAFNAPYDFTILHHEAIRNDVPALDAKSVLDPLVLDKHFVPRRTGKRTLGALSPHYEINLENAHTSAADALAAGRIAQQIARIFRKEISNDVFELHQQQIKWSDSQDENFEQFMQQHRPGFKARRGWPLKL